MIYTTEFTADYLQLVQGFDCGTTEWARDVNQWIKGDPSQPETALSYLALSSHERWTRVWICGEEEVITPATLVGYFAIGTGNWKLPTGREDVATIPFFGIDLRFQKKYHEEDESFATGLYADLLDKAENAFLPEVKYLGLHVDPRNVDAIDFWKKKGFVVLPSKIHRDLESGITFQGMISQFRD